MRLYFCISFVRVRTHFNGKMFPQTLVNRPEIQFHLHTYMRTDFALLQQHYFITIVGFESKQQQQQTIK